MDLYFSSREAEFMKIVVLVRSQFLTANMMFIIQFIQYFKGWPMSKQKIGVLGDFVPVVRHLAAPGFIKRSMSISGG